MIGDSTRFRRSTNVVAREVGGEQILLPLTKRAVDLTAVYVLNEVAKYLWDRLDGTRDLAALSDEVACEFEVTREQAHGDASTLVADLLEANLIEKAD